MIITDSYFYMSIDNNFSWIIFSVWKWIICQPQNWEPWNCSMSTYVCCWTMHPTDVKNIDYFLWTDQIRIWSLRQISIYRFFFLLITKNSVIQHYHFKGILLQYFQLATSDSNRKEVDSDSLFCRFFYRIVQCKRKMWGSPSFQLYRSVLVEKIIDWRASKAVRFMQLRSASIWWLGCCGMADTGSIPWCL